MTVTHHAKVNHNHIAQQRNNTICIKIPHNKRNAPANPETSEVVPHQSTSTHRDRAPKTGKRRHRGESADRKHEDDKTNNEPKYRRNPGDKTIQGYSNNGENDRNKHKNPRSYKVQLSRRETQDIPTPKLPPTDFSGFNIVHQQKRGTQHQSTDSGYNEPVPDNDEQGCTSTIVPPLDLPKRTTINTILPPEVILHIFQFLPLEDLGFVMQVCKWWYEISDTPTLWANKYIVINRSNVALMPRALNTWRLSKVKEIIVDTISPEAIEAVNNHEMITDVHVNNILNTVMGQTLATMVKKKEAININATHLNIV
jgi:hypothetical protein